jgi:hypothetical protein
VEIVVSRRRPTASTAGLLNHPSRTAVARLSRGAVPLNNSNTHNQVTNNLQNLSKDPSGFIYHTYRAVQRENHRDKPVTKRSNQEEAYVSATVGGSLSQISFQGGEYRNRTSSTNCGGVKGKVKGFSRVSRRNLLRRFACINRVAFRAYKGRVTSITLTYPSKYPENPDICKRHLKALYKRTKRRFGNFAGFWRMGIQARGAWHFHLLLFMPSSPRLLTNLRHFMASSWYEVCGEVSKGHLLTGTRVEEIRTWRRATSYAEKYMAKEAEFPEGLETGRIWGAWNKEFLPVQWETVKVNLQDALKNLRPSKPSSRSTSRRPGMPDCSISASTRRCGGVSFIGSSFCVCLFEVVCRP